MRDKSHDNFTLKTLRGFITPLCAGIILTILAPYNTDVFSPPLRALYWVGLCLAGGIGAVVADQAISRLGLCQHIWQKALVQSFGATLAVAPFVLLIHVVGKWHYFLLTLFYIWIIAIIIAAIGELLRDRQSYQAQKDLRPALFDRLPPKFRNAYVRIHSEAGEHMLLMRLSDSEDFTAPLEGLKPHRSWWVAADGVEEIIRSGGKLKIRLKSGKDVPVSREGAKRIKEAGWI